MNIIEKLKGLFNIDVQDNSSELKSSNFNNKETLQSAISKLSKIENIMFDFNNDSQAIYTQLLLFISYYSFIIEFYNKNLDKIVSVGELMLLKYIDMIFQVLEGYNISEKSADKEKEIIGTLIKINKNLYSKVTNIKENVDMNLVVDLKTIRDLTNFDI